MSHLSVTAAAMNPGEWRLLCQQGDGSNYGNPIWPPVLVAETGDGSSMYQYGYACGYDRQVDRQRVLILAGAHTGGIAKKDYVGFPAYDVPTNHWSNLRSALPTLIPDTGGNHHTYGMSCCVSSDRRFLWSEANTCVLNGFDLNVADLTANTSADWITYPSPAAYNGHNGRGFTLEFPDRDSLLMLVPDASVLTEKIHTASGWKTVTAFAPSPTYNPEGGVAAYNPVLKQVMFGGGSDGGSGYLFRFWIYRANGTIVSTANLAGQANVAAGPPYPRSDLYSKFWADPISGDYLFLSVNENYTGYYFYKYNVVANAWTRLSSLEASIPIDVGSDGGAHNYALDSLANITLPDMGVTMFISKKVYIYKHTANTDAEGLSFARKVSMPGTVAAYGFDSASNVRNYPAAAYPLRYRNVTGSCVAVLGTNYPYDSSVRGAGEANASAVPQTPTVCNYPQVDNAVYNAAGGGAGALRIIIPSQSGEGVGGYFDTPYQGVDNAKINLAPNNFGRVWYQMMVRTHNVTNANLFASLGGAVGPKIMIGYSVPPYVGGSDYQASHDVHTDIIKNGLFSGYTYAQQTGLESGVNLHTYDRNVGSNTLVQNAVNCIYTGLGAASYVNPPCVMLVPDTWQQMTWRYEVRPAASDFTISGNNLSKTNFFAGANGWMFQWVYIQDDGGGQSAFFKVHSKTNDNTVILTNSNSVDGATGFPNVIAGTPPQGGSRSVVISGYPNSIMEMWIDGLKIFSITDQPIHWRGFNIQTDAPAGFGAFRLMPHMTGKDFTVIHADAYYWYDDLIISTEPISMTQSTAAPTPPSTPSAPVLPWMWRT